MAVYVFMITTLSLFALIGFLDVFTTIRQTSVLSQCLLAADEPSSPKVIEDQPLTDKESLHLKYLRTLLLLALQRQRQPRIGRRRRRARRSGSNDNNPLPISTITLQSCTDGPTPKQWSYGIDLDHSWDSTEDRATISDAPPTLLVHTSHDQQPSVIHALDLHQSVETSPITQTPKTESEHPSLQRLMGTPDEEVWPGVKQLSECKPTFPQWHPSDLSANIPHDEDCGIDSNNLPVSSAPTPSNENVTHHSDSGHQTSVIPEAEMSPSIRYVNSVIASLLGSNSEAEMVPDAGSESVGAGQKMARSATPILRRLSWRDVEELGHQRASEESSFTSIMATPTPLVGPPPSALAPSPARCHSSPVPSSSSTSRPSPPSACSSPPSPCFKAPPSPSRPSSLPVSPSAPSLPAASPPPAPRLSSYPQWTSPESLSHVPEELCLAPSPVGVPSPRTIWHSTPRRNHRVSNRVDKSSIRPGWYGVSEATFAAQMGDNWVGPGSQRTDLFPLPGQITTTTDAKPEIRKAARSEPFSSHALNVPSLVANGVPRSFRPTILASSSAASNMTRGQRMTVFNDPPPSPGGTRWKAPGETPWHMAPCDEIMAMKRKARGKVATLIRGEMGVPRDLSPAELRLLKKAMESRK